jgi:GT2 family glycosyltransferase
MIPTLVSFVIATRNRRDELLRTLTQLQSCGLPRRDMDVWVVDNASTDHTVAAVGIRHPWVNVIPLKHNGGAVSRNAALSRCGGKYVVFLDDDSFPTPGSTRRMLDKFEADPHLGAAVFDVILPDGRHESSAYPDVFIGCGTGFRRVALEEVGGLPDDFFMQAEEYDLSLRLLDAGWRIRRFEDLIVHHQKTPTARRSARTTRMDVRNNLLLALRRLPAGQAIRFAGDWTHRYWWIASKQRHRIAFVRGLISGTARGLIGRYFTRHRRVSTSTFARFARLDAINHIMRSIADASPGGSVLLVDAGKNLTAFVSSARRHGLRPVAIADNHLCADGRRFRGIPIVDDTEARAMRSDAVVLTNMSPAHATARRTAWTQATGRWVWSVLHSTQDFPGDATTNRHHPQAPGPSAISGTDVAAMSASAGRQAEAQASTIAANMTPNGGITCADPAEAGSRRTVAQNASQAA